MVPCALLGARRVVFASANPLVSVTGNPSPAAAFFVCSPCPHYLRLHTTPSVAALLLSRLPGRLQCPREWSQVVLLRPVPRLAPTVREIRHRHIFPRSPGLNFYLLCAAAAFVLQQPLQQRRLPCCAAPTAQHQTQLGKPGDLFQRKQTEALENFFPDFDAQPSATFLWAFYLFCALAVPTDGFIFTATDYYFEL